MTQQNGPVYDLLLHGGTVYDPANGISGQKLDVAIVGGIIAAVQPDIPHSTARRTADVSGMCVVPGLIDMHAHFFGYFGTIQPDPSCLSTGVTTAVDVGGAGYRTFDRFNETVISQSKTRIFALLNIAGEGMVGEPEQDMADMSVDLSIEKIAQRPDVIIGIKVAHYAGPGWEPLDRGVEAAKQTDTYVMVDQTPQASRPMDDMLLKHLRPGDITTHCYATSKPMTDSNDQVFPYFFKARDRGVLFDVGHGSGSFSFRIAQAAIDQGFPPDTISTDLHVPSYLVNQATMPETMSKILACGVPLADVVEMSTWRPAQKIGHPELGTLSVTGVADVAVLRLAEGDFGFTDNGSSGNHVRRAGQRLEPEITIKGGRVEWDRNGLTRDDWSATVH